MILASSSGTPVPAIARLVAANEDTVRDVIHAFNQRGLAALDPHWAGGASRLISDDDVAFILATATTRPKKLGLPFTHFSIRKLAAYLQGRYGRNDRQQAPARLVGIRRKRLRQILAGHDITFQRTRTWKESTDPDYESKLDRIEQVTTQFLGRCFAFDQFGPLSIRPCHGTCWAARNHPDRLRATYTRTHGIRYLHGCYDLSNDKLWGVLRRRKGGDHTLSAFKTIRAARPGRGTDLRDLRQPVREQNPHHQGLGGPAQSRVVPHPDQHLVGRPDRSPVRATTNVHHGQLRLPEPRRTGPRHAGIPALAQRQRPAPRRDPRATPRTRPRPQRTPPTLGPPTRSSGLTERRPP
jgi:hypothetical protein